MNIKHLDITGLFDDPALFKPAMAGAPVAMTLSDRKGRFFFHNKAFQTLLEYGDKDITGKGFGTIFIKKSMGMDVLKEVSQGEPFNGEADVLTKSGSIIPVMLNAVPVSDETGVFNACLCVYTDLTRAREIEKKLACQREYQATLHSISLGMFRRVEVTELLTAVLVRASRLTGIPNGFLHLYDPEKQVLVIKAACGNLIPYIGHKVKPGQGLTGKVFESGEPMIVNDYGTWTGKLGNVSSEYISSIVCIPLVSGSRIEGVIGLTQNRENEFINPEVIAVLEEFSGIARLAIDSARLFENQKLELEKRIALEKERKEMELRLLQAQKMESIGTLAGGVAHDFNNILSAIMGFTQIAMGDAPKDSMYSSDLDEIYKASLRAKDLVQQILTFARQSDDEMNPVKVSLIVKEVLKFIRSSIPTTITIEQNIKSVSKAVANPTKLYQVFLNLFTNASQAMEERGGLLKVDMQDIVLDHPLESLSPGSYIRIMISDTGTGISKDHIPHIFEPYFTTRKKGEGTGLGLAVVHGAVKSMKGDIFVESEPGKGTGFTIYFPFAEEKVYKSDFLKKEASSPLGQKEHILFVDDEVSINQMWKRLLESLNYKVTAFDGSSAALEAFRANANGFHVVVTDMTMPGMTGDRLAQELKKIRPDIPIILCTGLSMDICDLKAKGIDYYCVKPVLKSELAAVVRKAIEEREGKSAF